MWTLGRIASSFQGRFFAFDLFIEQLHHAFIVVIGFAVDREHAEASPMPNTFCPVSIPNGHSLRAWSDGRYL